MSLLTEAQAIARRPGGTCGVSLLVRSLSESEQAELHEALMADSVSSKALAAALKLRGHNIAYNTIQRHRRRDCACHESA